MTTKSWGGGLVAVLTLALAGCATAPEQPIATQPVTLELPPGDESAFTPPPPPVTDAAPPPGSAEESVPELSELPVAPEPLPMVVEAEPAPEPMPAPAPVVASAVLASAKVAAVQPPAWVEREGQRVALKAGAAVEAGDQFVTGPGARLHLQLEDQSWIKLGEKAQVEMPLLQVVREAGTGDSLFQGALNVLKGAFRYTTTQARRRDFTVNIGGVVTAGIRGTDIWGKSDGSQDLIALLDGEIEVRSPGRAALVMDRPATFYAVSKDGAPQQGIAPVGEARWKAWAAETELSGAPALHEDGRWAVALVSVKTLDGARRRAEQLWAQGYPAEVFEVTIKGQAWYRIALAGYASQADAKRYAEIAKGQGFPTAWTYSLKQP